MIYIIVGLIVGLIVGAWWGRKKSTVPNYGAYTFPGEYTIPGEVDVRALLDTIPASKPVLWRDVTNNERKFYQSLFKGNIRLVHTMDEIAKKEIKNKTKKGKHSKRVIAKIKKQRIK